MTTSKSFASKTKELIDDLKGVCANYGLGNDASEFKIITQVFLYKFMNDKFAYEVKLQNPELAKSDNWEQDLRAMSDDDYEMLEMILSETTARLRPKHFISTLYEKQNESDFAALFDKTLVDIATSNSDIFSVTTSGGSKVTLFENVSTKIEDTDERASFCKALINKLVEFSFEGIFEEKYDFFATIFEYLIKDYNSDSGGKYAEYYTPHAVAKIIASCLVTEDNVQNVSCYDPSAGSGTLLMSLAHHIGEDKCSIFSQDISQKSSNLLRLNLILNNLVHSIPNIVQGNTILKPKHLSEKFDYIVSNPPFKLDFSDFRNDLETDANKERFFAGIPKIKAKSKDKMEIYLLFIQHIMHSMKPDGKAAIVVPTGFITAQSGIDKKIRQQLVERKMLAGVVSMPSNIFATTGTNVSIIFLDGSNKEDVVLIDASKLGKKVKEGKNQKTVLTTKEEDKIITTFNNKEQVEEFSVTVTYEEITSKNFSLSAGQYFEIEIKIDEITQEDFDLKISEHSKTLTQLFKDSRATEDRIKSILNSLS